ncbi:MAG: hypothetical protein CR985_03760 [Flavobacteriales bacterium]|nr:MAG: hypothetical protein CR985_03760 [Flavobacteriales bacterium]
MNKIKFIGLLSVLTAFLVSCSTAKSIERTMERTQKENTYFKGFVVYNPVTNKTLINYNGHKYFTPASNTKLFTFYAAYKALKDSVKSLAYYKTTDSLIIKGTADPSFLYGFNDDDVLQFLATAKDTIYLLDRTIDEPFFGNGWAWNDYPYYYMPEKSLFPVNGNTVNYGYKNGLLSVFPQYFTSAVIAVDSLKFLREYKDNKFYIKKYTTNTYTVPFKTNSEIVAAVLSDTLQKPIKLLAKGNKEYNFKYLYGNPIDSLFKQMLTVSDNFIAEQLLLQVGEEVSGYYNVDSAINYTLKHYLKDLPQKPRWVDGSGLSRYNLFTPQTIVALLTKMYYEIPREKLLHYFPVGGKSGTIKSWYANEGKPYIYAKTGTLSNNHCLSGYLITQKGTLLIFSYMNNHYPGSSIPIKKQMERDLKRLYIKY